MKKGNIINQSAANTHAEIQSAGQSILELNNKTVGLKLESDNTTIIIVVIIAGFVFINASWVDLIKTLKNKK